MRECAGIHNQAFTYKRSMKSDIVQDKIRQGLIAIYRRQSFKGQSKAEFKHQLRKIQSYYPSFTISHSTKFEEKETISGKASLEKRIAGKLGTLLRHLKRHPEIIMLVSSADRIARRRDVFLALQAQGFGKRIYVASTGKCLDQIIVDGDHTRIERKTIKQQESCQRGRERYLADGGMLGNPAIKEQSAKGTKASAEKATHVLDEVLDTVKTYSLSHRGAKASKKALCDELDERRVRTVQGNPFTPVRLSQLKKRNAKAWEWAEDSYTRPRRRIMKIVSAVTGWFAALREVFLLKLQREALVARFAGSPLLLRVCREAYKAALHLPLLDSSALKTRGADGCRGPPCVGQCALP